MTSRLLDIITEQPDSPVMPTKPARDIIAKAMPRPNGGFNAQFAWPGVAPELVSGDDDKPIVFRDEHTAEVAAMTRHQWLQCGTADDARQSREA